MPRLRPVHVSNAVLTHVAHTTLRFRDPYVFYRKGVLLSRIQDTFGDHTRLPYQRDTMISGAPTWVIGTNLMLHYSRRAMKRIGESTAKVYDQHIEVSRNVTKRIMYLPAGVLLPAAVTTTEKSHAIMIWSTETEEPFDSRAAHKCIVLSVVEVHPYPQGDAGVVAEIHRLAELGPQDTEVLTTIDRLATSHAMEGDTDALPWAWGLMQETANAPTITTWSAWDVA